MPALSFSELTIEGFAGEQVPCVLFEPPDRRGGALVLPGAVGTGGRVGGSPARPDLHYTRALLLELGWAVLEVWWDASRWDESEAWLHAHAEAALATLADVHDPTVLVGRSIGTWALATLEDDRAKRVWVAPLLQLDPVRSALQRSAARSFVVTGTEDRGYDAGRIERLQDAGARVALIDGGDHGFDVGDAAESARPLAAALDELRAFLVE